MSKRILWMIIPLLVNHSAVAQDITFYRLHPVELQTALQQCPVTQPAGVSCEQLNKLAIRTNQFVSELQYNPQIFGQRILSLQETQAKLKMELVDKPGALPLQTAFDENKMQLRERLAIVKWLESPRG